jgi:thiamine pyrophosphokinase
MRLPNNLSLTKEWTLVGPLGPQVPDKLLSHPLLAVDGGSAFCPRIDVWVGDRDSSHKKIDCDHQFEFSPQKDLSDFALALKLFHQLPSITLHLWGFLGGRRDHEMMNFGEICHFLSLNPSSQAIFYNAQSEDTINCLGQGQWLFNHSGLFSLASLRPVHVTLTGQCQYQITEKTQLSPLSSLGLSNIANGEFTLTNDGPVLLYLLESLK